MFAFCFRSEVLFLFSFCSLCSLSLLFLSLSFGFSSSLPSTVFTLFKNSVNFGVVAMDKKIKLASPDSFFRDFPWSHSSNFQHAFSSGSFSQCSFWGFRAYLDYTASFFLVPSFFTSPPRRFMFHPLPPPVDFSQASLTLPMPSRGRNLSHFRCLHEAHQRSCLFTDVCLQHSPPADYTKFNWHMEFFQDPAVLPEPLLDGKGVWLQFSREFVGLRKPF